MTCQEFNKLSGLDVPEYNYDKIEAIYMNAGEMDKETFAKAYKQLIGRDDAVDLVYELSDAVTRREDIINNYKAIANEAVYENDQLRERLEERNQERTKLIEEREQLRNAANKANAKVQQAAKLLLDAKLEQQAIELLGHAAVITLKIERNAPLNANDLAYISNNLK